jgi:hypothetical protein
MKNSVLQNSTGDDARREYRPKVVKDFRHDQALPIGKGEERRRGVLEDLRELNGKTEETFYELHCIPPELPAQRTCLPASFDLSLEVRYATGAANKR